MVSRANIQYQPTRLWGTGEIYRNSKPVTNSVEVRGYDGSAGSWTVYVLDIEAFRHPPSAGPTTSGAPGTRSSRSRTAGNP